MQEEAGGRRKEEQEVESIEVETHADTVYGQGGGQPVGIGAGEAIEVESIEGETHAETVYGRWW